MPKFCHNCGTALVEPGAFCSACGTAAAMSVASTKHDNHSSAVSTAIEADGRLRSCLWLIATALGVLLLGIVLVFTNRSSPPAGSPATSSTISTISTTEANQSPAPPAESTAEQHETVSSGVLQDGSGDHELRADGRVYSVALIVATPEIPVGAKLFAQGRVAIFDYASGMSSRRFVVIADEEQPGKTLLCGMKGDEGAEVFSLYHVGEVVAVSGEYIATTSLAGYPAMPLLRDCNVAGPQDNVVRPAPSGKNEQAKSDENSNGSQSIPTNRTTQSADHPPTTV